MTINQQLQNDVLAQLTWDPRVGDAEIEVFARDGVVALSGYVESHAAHHAAVRDVEAVRGVRGVIDDVQVWLPASSLVGDAELARRALRLLEWDVEVPHDLLRMTIHDGWITLDGVVSGRHQREAAEHALRHLAGVRGITNRIEVRAPLVPPADVRQAIHDALRRDAELAGDAIDVAAAEGVVTLRGRVRAYAERRDLERVVWSAPGIVNVDDRIAVAPLAPRPA